MNNLSPEQIVSDLRELGLGPTDKVLVRADMGKIGRMKPNPKRMLIDALLEVVGNEGAIIGLSFTKTQTLFRRSKAWPFTKDEQPITGAFAKQLLAYPGAYRSSHPTNSFVAIGNFREAIENHSSRKHCFEPMSHLIDQNGKMLLIGCTYSGPGFSTVHLAQHALGYSTKNFISNLIGRYHWDENSGALSWYSKKDIPGCSMGFAKFYPYYEEARILKKGKIGNAEAFLVDASSAYKIEHAILKQNPKFALCDRDECESCRLFVTLKLLEPVRYAKSRLKRVAG